MHTCRWTGHEDKVKEILDAIGDYSYARTNSNGDWKAGRRGGNIDIIKSQKICKLMPKKKNNKILNVGINQLMLTTGKIITFNNEQSEGINKIRHWLKNGEIFFTLSGHAGTGKEHYN